MEYKHELVLPNADLPFKMFVFEGKEGNYVREKHWHRSLEIFAVFEGKLKFFLNDEEYQLETGEFIIVNSNEVHSIFAPKENFTIVLQIPLNTFEHYFCDGQFILFSHEPSVQNAYVMELIQNMFQAYYEEACGYEFLVQSLYYKLLHTFVTEYRVTDISPEQLRGYKKLNRLSEITTYIKKNYQTDLSLESLAETFGYSPTYLSKMFQKYARINYREYLMNIRLECAHRELISTNHMIGDIAVNQGFANSKAFAKAFKKRYGVLPSEYRKEREEAGEN